MSAIPQRSHFEIHRAAEYFSAKELSAQTGQPEAMFPTVVFKELVDNALDAAENAGINPRIGIVATNCTGGLVLSVQDNGPGIPPGLIAKILDFNTRTSDKAAYRGPTRGQQGNALKTIVGIAHVCNGLAVIESRGIRHTIQPEVTPAGTVKTNHRQEPCDRNEGTRVTVKLQNLTHRYDFRPWALSYELFNPHAEVKIQVFEQTENGDCTCSISGDSVFSKTVDFYFDGDRPAFSKFRPSDPTSIHWYGAADFHALAYLGGDQTPLCQDRCRFPRENV